MILQREPIWDLTKVYGASFQLTIGLCFIDKTAMHLLSKYHHNNSELLLRVRNENLIFLFLKQNICCGYSKEPSQ